MKQDKFKERAERLGITQKYLWQVEDFFYMGIWIKDVYQDGSSNIFRYGEDEHDSLCIIAGEVHYMNLQNGDGCPLRIEPETMSEPGYHLTDWDYLTDEDLRQIIEAEKRCHARYLLLQELFQIAAKLEKINDSTTVQKLAEDLRDCAATIELEWEDKDV